MTEIVLYNYWRSSACYRVRIALNLMGLDYRLQTIDLLQGEHKSAKYVSKNAQGLVPSLEIDGKIFTQSIAIIEYLSDIFPEKSLLPLTAEAKAHVRILTFAIAMEIHPICNTSVVEHVMNISNGGKEEQRQWMQKMIGLGLQNFESCLGENNEGTSKPATQFCFGDKPSMADCCLIPQLYNAERWGADYSSFTKIRAIEKSCRALEAFQFATPENCQT